jgi:hypothetical protein
LLTVRIRCPGLLTILSKSIAIIDSDTAEKSIADSDTSKNQKYRDTTESVSQASVIPTVVARQAQ